MTDSSLPPEIRREVEKIRQQYLRNLPKKIRRLGELKADCVSEGWNGDSRAKLKDLAHQLAGSLGIHNLNLEQSKAEAIDIALEQSDLDAAAITRLLNDLIELLRNR